jgi:ribonuclease P protein component
MVGPIDHEGEAVGSPPFFRLETLKKRREFKEASGGVRYSTPAFTMLRRPGALDGSRDAPRFGLTVTKKLGNSPARNRIRRRLRAAIRAAAPQLPKQGIDLVILARQEAIAIAFITLVADVARAASVLAMKPDRNAGTKASSRPAILP